MVLVISDVLNVKVVPMSGYIATYCEKKIQPEITSKAKASGDSERREKSTKDEQDNIVKVISSRF